MERKCPECHTPNPETEKFCRDCGRDLCNSPIITPINITRLITGTGRIIAPDGKSDILGNPLNILPPGTILKNKYSIKYLTAGGMGAIYTARDVNTSEEFIIKEAYSALQAKREEFIIALTQERETLIRLSHPGIVKVVDFFKENDACYMVMEHIKGESLESYRKSQEEINQEIIIEWGIELCGILGYLHGLNPPIIYRDLKPSNVLITKDNTVKLIDFGIARVYKQDAVKDTIALGTQGLPLRSSMAQARQIQEPIFTALEQHFIIFSQAKTLRKVQIHLYFSRQGN